jgi:3'-phosphoadenosine 5'-phosphosulfate sulfotransferase (PAPS reductase)/FAD synthetase
LSFIQKNKLPYPCFYDEGFPRIGCVICPFIMHRNPHQLRCQHYQHVADQQKRAPVEKLPGIPDLKITAENYGK